MVVTRSSISIPTFPNLHPATVHRETAAENKAAMEGGIGHYGTYTFDPATKVISLKVEGSTYRGGISARSHHTRRQS